MGESVVVVVGDAAESVSVIVVECGDLPVEVGHLSFVANRVVLAGFYLTEWQSSGEFSSECIVCPVSGSTFGICLGQFVADFIVAIAGVVVESIGD